MESLILTTAQAAERLGVSTARIRQLCAQGRFPGAFRAGRDWMIPAEAVQAFTPNPIGVRLDREQRKNIPPETKTPETYYACVTSI